MFKNYVSWLLCLIFLSTIFVGCKPQEHPPKSPIMVRQAHQPVAEKKVVEKNLEKVSEKPAFVPAAEIPETFAEEEPVLKNDERSVTVNVTAEGLAVKDAMVTLASKTPGGNFLREKKTDETGAAKFSISKTIFFFYVTAYNDDYAAVNIMKGGLSPKKLSPVTINLDLKEKGITITGILENNPEKIKFFNARIEQSMSSSGYPEIFVISTNIVGNKIKFPPIESNVNGLRVCVEGKNIPQCYSEVFDTKEGENKEVKIEIPMNVTLKGTALLPDGSPVTNSFTALVFPVDKSKGIHQAGVKINQQIHPENDGSYELSGLAQGNFEIRFMLSNYKPYETKLCLVPPETELDFSFVKVPESSFCGIVINGYDKDPIEGVTVSAHPWSEKPAYASCVTDKDGKFSLELQERHPGSFGEIVVNEPEYGKVIKQIQKNDKYIKIILFQGGSVKGTVMTKNGTTIARENVRIEMIERGLSESAKKVSWGSDDYASYHTLTDAEGKFEFLNVVAPAKYGFEVQGTRNSGYTLPSYHTGKGITVDIEVDKTAECDLIVQKPGTIAIRGKDIKGNPVLEFDFTYRLYYGTYDGDVRHVDISEDEWFYFNLMSIGKFQFSCIAKEKEGGFFSFLKSKKEIKLTAVTNNIPVSDKITNYVTLVFSQSEPNLSGTVFKPDGTPAKDTRVLVRAKGKWKDTRADDKGNFELRGFDIKKGEMMKVEASSWQDKSYILTNLIEGTKNVILNLKEPYQITGKVYFEDLETPAKNFVVGEGYDKQSYNSVDGSFIYDIRQSWRNNSSQGSIKISFDNYLPGTVNYNFTTNSVCDVGNIILKSE